MDPKPSIWTQQHKFITRLQQTGEFIKHYATSFKKLTLEYEFNCNRCKDSELEVFTSHAIH